MGDKNLSGDKFYLFDVFPQFVFMKILYIDNNSFSKKKNDTVGL